MDPTLYLIVAIAAVAGGVWRFAFGHNWSPVPPATPDWIEKHARVCLTVLGVAFAALIIFINGASYFSVAAGAAFTGGYFAIGNGTVLRGPTDPAWPYARALILKYLCPALLANLVMWFLGYQTAIGAAGAVAALGYFGFWRPDPHGTDPWNQYAEALSGAAWFGLLALTF